MSKNNCKITLGKVFDFLANDLEAGDMDQVKNHLRECDSCRKEFAIESKISSLISNSSIDAQTSFASKMQSRLQSEL